MPYDVGDSVPIAWDVKNAAGVLVNAGTVTLTVTLPDGTTATPAVGVPSVTGQYRETYVPASAGRYVWNVVTLNPNTAISDVFEVRQAVSPSLLSLADAKTHLKIPSATTTFDEQLRDFLESATEIVESYIGPVVRRTYTYRVNGGRDVLILPHTQVTAVTALTSVQTGAASLALASLSIDTQAGDVFRKDGGCFPGGRYDITYTVGRSVVKANWSTAARIIVKHLWETQLGNLPAIQGDTPGYVVTGSGYIVPYLAISLLNIPNSAQPMVY